MRSKTTKQSLSDIVRDEIKALILSQDFENNKLPSEHKLAEHFGVSLSVVREALQLLREKGFITKKHGSGNYFHMSAARMGVRLDQFEGFLKFLQDLGHEPKDEIASLGLVKPGPEVYGAMGLDQDEKILLYERRSSVEGVPAIYCYNYLPVRYFSAPYETYFRSPMSIFEIINNCFHRELACGISEFTPGLATEKDLGRINTQAGKPIIIMTETYYTLEDDPVAYSINTFNHDIVPMRILSR